MPASMLFSQVQMVSSGNLVSTIFLTGQLLVFEQAALRVFAAFQGEEQKVVQLAGFAIEWKRSA